jgi:hypothetical protein
MSARFLALLEARGLAYTIAWQWDASSKYRNGVIIVHTAAGPQAGAVAEAVFVRNTHFWTPADERIGKLRTGSPKHFALLALIKRINTEN